MTAISRSNLPFDCDLKNMVDVEQQFECHGRAAQLVQKANKYFKVFRFWESNVRKRKSSSERKTIDKRSHFVDSWERCDKTSLVVSIDWFAIGSVKYGMLWFVAAVLAMQAQEEVKVSSHTYVARSPYTLSVDSKLVDIPAIVRDRHGKAISDLTRGDFAIADNGKPRPIESFAIDRPMASASNSLQIGKQTVKALDGATTSTIPGVAPPQRFLALFVDDVNGKDGALAGDLKRTQTAAEKFIKETIAPNVRIGVFTVSGSIAVDFTGDVTELTQAISALKPHIRMRESGLTPCPRITPYFAYLIAHDGDRGALSAVLYDAGTKSCPITAEGARVQAEETLRKIKEISNDTFNAIGRVMDHLGAMPGKRELLIATSGFLATGLQEEEKKLIEQALRTGVVVNALDSKGLYGEAVPGTRPTDFGSVPLSSPAQIAQYLKWKEFETVELSFRLQMLNESVENLAEGTGGIFFQNDNDLSAGFRELGKSPDASYRLGIRLNDVILDGGYHKLKVSLVNQKGHYSIQARPGYFAPNDKSAAESLRAKIDRAILAEDSEAQFPVGIRVKKSQAGLAVIVSVDISKLRFVKQGDRQMQRLVFTTALIDSNGNMTAKEGMMELALKEDTYKRFLSTGIEAVLNLPVSPGVYKLRQVSEETVDGKIASSTHSIKIQ